MAIWTQNRSIRIPLLLLLGVEFSAVVLAIVGSAIAYSDGAEMAQKVINPLLLKSILVAAVTLVSLISMGLYHFHQRLYFRELIARIAVGVALAALGLAAIFSLYPVMAMERQVTTSAFIIAFVAILVIRFYFFRNIDTHIFRRRTLIYGAGKRSQAIAGLRRRSDRRGFVVVGTVPSSEDLSISQREHLVRDQSLREISKEKSVDEIVIAMDDRRGYLPVRELLDCKLSGINVIDIVEFLERESEKVRTDLVNPSSLIFSAGFRVSRLRRFSKRLFDVVVSSISVLVVWPLFLLVAVAIKIEDGLSAPILYRQDRVGQWGKAFPILKFRSMVENAELESGAVWAQKDDTRITSVGQFIRKIRFDELPQLINVLRGDMSLVGPRPERPEFVEKLIGRIPYYGERHTVKPGITGWAQLRYSYGSSEDDAIQKLQYDLYYVKNQSLILDITIMLQTIEVVVWGIGSR